MTLRNLSLVRFIAMAALVAAAPLGCAQEGDEGDDNGTPAPSATTGTGADELVAQVVYDAAVVKADSIEFPLSVVPEKVLRRIAAYQAAVTPKLVERTRRDVFGETIVESAVDFSDLLAQEAATKVEKVILFGAPESRVTPGTEIDQDTVHNASGYLRRATGFVIDGDRLTVYTAPATLAEYFGELKLGQELIGEEQDGLGTRRAPLTVPFNFNLVNIVNRQLFSKTGSFNAAGGSGSGSLAVSIKKATVDLGGQLDIGVDIGLFGLNEAHLKLDGNLGGSIDFQAVANGSFSTSTGTIKLLPRPSKFALPPIGPVPLTLKVDLTANCKLNVNGQANATVGGDVKATVAVGFQFRDGDLSNIGRAPAFTANLHPPALSVSAAANGRCAVVPTLEVLMFDAAGPSIGIEAFADAQLKAGAAFGAQSNASASASLKVGANFLVGGEIQAPLFDFQLLDFGTVKVLGLESKPKTFALLKLAR